MMICGVVITLSLGTLMGPMLVGLYRVLLPYARSGHWQPNQLWGKTTLNNLYGGIVYFAMLFAVFIIGVPVQNASMELGLLIGFLSYGVVRLFWFHTFQILSDHDQPWIQALRQGWNLEIPRLGSHLLLVLLINLPLILPVDSLNNIVLEFLLVHILLSFSVVVQAVAYVALVPQPLAGTSDP